MNRNTQDLWDLIPCDSEKKKKCDLCGKIGLYVREVKEASDERN